MKRTLSAAPFVVWGIALACGVLLALSGAGPFSEGCGDFGELPEGSSSSSSLSIVPPEEKCEYVTPSGRTTSSVTLHWDDLLFAVLLAAAIGCAFWPLRERSVPGLLKGILGTVVAVALIFLMFVSMLVTAIIAFILAAAVAAQISRRPPAPA